MAAASSKGVSRATSTGLSSALDDLLDILEDDDMMQDILESNASNLSRKALSSLQAIVNHFIKLPPRQQPTPASTQTPSPNINKKTIKSTKPDISYRAGLTPKLKETGHELSKGKRTLSSRRERKITRRASDQENSDDTEDDADSTDDDADNTEDDADNVEDVTDVAGNDAEDQDGGDGNESMDDASDASDAASEGDGEGEEQDDDDVGDEEANNSEDEVLIRNTQQKQKQKQVGVQAESATMAKPGSKRCADLASLDQPDNLQKRIKSQPIISTSQIPDAMIAKVVEAVTYRGRWNTILNMHSLQLVPEIERLIGMENQATSFLCDFKVLRHDFYNKTGTTGDVYYSYLAYARQLETRQALDRCRQLFIMLFLFALLQMQFPRSTGRRIGSRQINAMLARLLESACDEKASESQRKSDKHNMIKKDIPLLGRWIKCGMRLNGLVQRFGEGCLFYLWEALSLEVLSRRLSSSGTAYDHAINHLDNLNIAQKAESSGLNGLGKAIMSELMRPFTKQTQVK